MSSGPDYPKQERKSTMKRWQIVLIILVVLLITLAFFLSINVDGIGLISIIFPFSFFILLLAIFSFILGYRTRKTSAGWFVYSLVILFSGFITLWTPVLKNTRELIERNWRWESREQVVKDIQSGKLKAFMNVETGINGYTSYYVAVPFKTYGRVSFRNFGEKDNVVEVLMTTETGMIINFTTDGGFFGPVSYLSYVKNPGSFGVNHSPSIRLNDHWYSYQEEKSWIRL